MPSHEAVKTRIRVLVVDDSAFVRRALIRMFEGSQEITICDVAADGAMAIELIKNNRPDVVTMDVQMPVLDGLSALERIMQECPVPVVMLSSLTGRGGEQTLRALELGAVDFIDKSSAGGPMEFGRLQQELTAKILVAARIDLNKIRSQSEKKASLPRPPAPAPPPAGQPGEAGAIFIGISTGGPPALQAILGSLPAAFPVPIFIVQHMPVGFTASLAERLDRSCRIGVKEARDGEIALAGTAYIAPGGQQMTVKRSGDGEVRICLAHKPADTLHKPSVDVLFQSAAQQFGSRAVAFVLTGMGRDGSAGAVALKKAGGRVLVEAEETSVVFGMPKAAMEAVQVDGVVPLYSVAETMLTLT